MDFQMFMYDLQIFRAMYSPLMLNFTYQNGMNLHPVYKLCPYLPTVYDPPSLCYNSIQNAISNFIWLWAKNPTV